MNPTDLFLYFWLALALTLGFRLLLIMENLSFSGKKKDQLSPELKKVYPEPVLKKALAYHKKGSQLSAILLTLGLGWSALFLATPLASWLQGLSQNMSSFSQLAFILLTLFFLTLTGLPGALLSKYLVERPFGFDKQNLGGFFKDQLLSLFVSIVLLSLFFLALQWIQSSMGDFWWLFAWGAYVVFQWFIILIYPMWIAPLFNRFQPLEEGPLKSRLKDLCEQLEFPMQDLYVMDGSRRSSHSNAYFTGFGPWRKIVLFDTLIEKHSVEELAAVLAHEIGHYKKKHVLFSLVLSTIFSLGAFFLFSFLLNWSPLFLAFDLEASLASLFVLLIFAQKPLNFLLSPLASYFSRKAEYEADAFAQEAMGSEEPLVSALCKLSQDNLSNPLPSPLYTWFYYSHPPLDSRIQGMKKGKKAHD